MPSRTHRFRVRYSETGRPVRMPGWIKNFMETES